MESEGGNLDKNIPAPLSHTALIRAGGMVAHLPGPEGRDIKNIYKIIIIIKNSSLPAYQPRVKAAKTLWN